MPVFSASRGAAGSKSKKGLTQHMTQKHTQIKTDFNCMNCKKSLSSQSSLNRHVKACKEKNKKTTKLDSINSFYT